MKLYVYKDVQGCYLEECPRRKKKDLDEIVNYGAISWKGSV